MPGISSLAASERLAAWGTKYRYAKLHTNDPGAAGTANAATNTTRVQIDWDTPDTSVPGIVTMTHTDQLDWSAVPASETYRYVTYWSASSGGDYGGNGPITPSSVGVGEDWYLPAGALDVTQPTAVTP
jgi:hypothetical protein